jgi:hypothetical protein
MADEAARLLGAAEDWARRRAAGLDAEHLATGAAECTVCPVCQAVGALRTVRPEAVAHLLDAAASLVAALRAAVPPGPAPGPGPGVQRIDLDEPPAAPPASEGVSWH